jgi:TP901 family phage tail tape measure protein
MADDKQVTIRFVSNTSGLNTQAAEQGLRAVGAAADRAAELDKTSAAAVKVGSSGKGLTGFVQKLGEATDKAALASIAVKQAADQLGLAGARINEISAAALNATAQFDAAQTKVSTLTDDVAGFTTAMEQSSQSLRGQVSATELLSAGYDVLYSGFTKTADSQAVLEAATKGAIGGFSDVNTVSDALTSTLNAYGLTAEAAAAVTDKFIATQNAGKIVVDQYAQQIGKVAPLAAQAGVSLDELNGFIATATIKGVQAEPAFSGLRAAISAVLKPSEEAKDLAQQLGVSFDAQALKTKGLAGILADLNAKGADTPEVLTQLFGSVEAVAAIAPSTGEGMKLLGENIQASANAAGSAETAFNKVAGSMEGQTKAAMTEVNAALVSMGSGVATAVTPLVQGLTFLLQNFNALPEPVKQTTGVLIALTGGALTVGGALLAIAAVLPVLQAGFGVITGLFAGTAVATTAVAGSATAVVAGLGAEAVAATAAAGALGGTATAGVASAAAQTAVAGSATAAAGGFAAMGAAMLAALPPLLALAAALATLKLIKDTIDLKTSNEEFAALSNGADVASAGSQRLADKLKALNVARSQGRSFTAAEVTQQKQLVQVATEQIGALDQQLAQVKAFKPATEEQKNAQTALIAQLEISKRSLQTQTSALEQAIAAKGKDAAASQVSVKALEAEKAARKQAAEAFKEARVAEAERRDEGFKQIQDDRQSAFNDAKRERDQAFQDQQQAAQEAFQERQQATQEAFQAKLAAQREAFQTQEAAIDKTNQEDKQRRAEAFQAREAAIAKVAQSERQAKEDQFRAQQEQRDRVHQAQKQAQERAFQDQQQRLADAFKLRQQTDAQAFQARQETAEAAFKQRLQDQEAAFRQAQRDRDAANTKAFSDAERLIQLQGTQDEAERARLQEQQRIIDQVRNLEAVPMKLDPAAAVKLAEQIAGVTAAAGEEAAAQVGFALQQLQAEQARRLELGDQAGEADLKAQQTEAEKSFQTQQQEAEKAFQLQQQEAERAFQAQQQEAERAFRLQIQAEADARTVQQRTEERAFKAELDAIDEQLQAQKRDREKAFKAELDAVDAQLQAQKKEREKAFAAEIRAAEKAQQQQQRAEEKAFRLQQRAEQRAYEAAERQTQRQFEAEQQAREKAHKAQMREFDKQTALETKQILESAKITPPEVKVTIEPGADSKPEVKQATEKPQPRRLGGAVAAGQAYLVGEVEPELFVPQQSGVILNRAQARANLDLLARVAAVQIGPAAMPLPGPPTDLHTLIAETRALHATIARRQPQIQIPVEFKGSEVDFDRFLRLQRATQRALV